MFTGYLAFGSTEIINQARTQAYITKNLSGFPLRHVRGLEDLAEALGDEPYESPLVDDAPWLDGSNPASRGFYGLYPLSIEGVESSTRTAEVLEGVGEGATVGQARHGSRQIRVRGLLLAADALGLEAGASWLEAALAGTDCAGGGCEDNKLYYFAGVPELREEFLDKFPASDLGVVFGSVSPATSPLVARPSAGWGKVSAEWHVENAAGVVVRWGAMGPTSSSVLESHGPVIPFRTNFIQNPTFAVGTTGWTSSGPAVTRHSLAGGVDDQAYAHRAPTTPAVVRYNWLADPSFENISPQSAGWSSNGALTRVPDAAAPNRKLVVSASPPAAAGALWVTAPILGPAAPAAGRISFSVAPLTVDLQAWVVSAAGVPSAVTTFAAGTLTAAWNVRFIDRTFGQGSTLYLQTATATSLPIKLDAMSAGEGGVYFDGDTPDSGVTHAWLATANNSPSSRIDAADGVVWLNLAANPRAAATTGSTTPTSDGTRNLVVGFFAGERSRAWQDTAHRFQGGTASVAIEWSDQPYPDTFYPDTMYPA